MAQLRNHRFRLGTTSFIYPADYITNARKLLPRVDELELLLFESHQLPSTREITELGQMARDMGKTYNVHLPMDISMGDPSADIRSKSASAIARAVECVGPLSPTTHTLHLTCETPLEDEEAVEAWQTRSTESVTQLLRDTGIGAQEISVETLEFDPQWLAPIVEDLDLAVCLDVGHVIRYGFDLSWVLERFASRVTIVHLHGIQHGVDHHAIDHLDPQTQRQVADFLYNFSGSLSLEVFSLSRFEQSMNALPALISHGTGKAAEREA